MLEITAKNCFSSSAFCFIGLLPLCPPLFPPALRVICVAVGDCEGLIYW